MNVNEISQEAQETALLAHNSPNAQPAKPPLKVNVSLYLYAGKSGL